MGLRHWLAAQRNRVPVVARWSGGPVLSVAAHGPWVYCAGSPRPSHQQFLDWFGGNLPRHDRVYCPECREVLPALWTWTGGSTVALPEGVLMIQPWCRHGVYAWHLPHDRFDLVERDSGDWIGQPGEATWWWLNADERQAWEHIGNDAALWHEIGNPTLLPPTAGRACLYPPSTEKPVWVEEDV